MAWRKSIQDYLSTRDFKKELVRNFPDFKGYDQHDAHELCVDLLDTMSKELNRVKKKAKYQELKIKPSESIEKQAMKYKKYYSEIEDSIITDYFRGQNMTEIK